MTKKQAQKVVMLKPLLNALKEIGVIDATMYENRIHLEEKSFLEAFPEYRVIDRNSEEYPYELQCEYCGIMFFCVTKTKEV